jgi:hypothetical protein
MTTVTNFHFADLTGLHYTMASRLRNGERKPGLSTVIAVFKAFALTCDDLLEWLDAIDQGAEQSGIWLRANIFESGPDETESETVSA